MGFYLLFEYLIVMHFNNFLHSFFISLSLSVPDDQ